MELVVKYVHMERGRWRLQFGNRSKIHLIALNLFSHFAHFWSFHSIAVCFNATIVSCDTNCSCSVSICYSFAPHPYTHTYQPSHNHRNKRALIFVFVLCVSFFYVNIDLFLIFQHFESGLS